MYAAGFGCFDGRDKVLGTLSAHSLEGFYVLDGEGVEICDVGDPALSDKKVNDLRAETVYIHCALGGEVYYSARDLGGACRIDTTYRRARAVVILDYGVTAGGADGRHLEDLFCAVALGLDALGDLGNDLARLADYDGIADADILLFYKVDVV